MSNSWHNSIYFLVALLPKDFSASIMIVYKQHTQTIQIYSNLISTQSTFFEIQQF